MFIKRCQGGSLLPLQHHHLITEVFGVLLDRCQFGQGPLSYQEFLEISSDLVIEGTDDQVFQPAPLRCEGFTDDRLQGRIAWANNLLGS